MLRHPKVIIVATVVLAAVVAAGFFLAVNIRRLRQEAREATCRGKLCQMALAIRNYSADFGSLPPAYLVDSRGLRAHSWRVLVLPYLEWQEQELYKRYSFSEPWNGPTNRLAVDSGPADVGLGYFRCPDDSDLSGQCTSILCVVGPQTFWPGSGTVPSDALTNNPKSILLVALPKTGIHWLEPKDITIEELRSLLATSDSPVFFVTADGTSGILEGNEPDCKIQK